MPQTAPHSLPLAALDLREGQRWEKQNEQTKSDWQGKRITKNQSFRSRMRKTHTHTNTDATMKLSLTKGTLKEPEAL